jgi:hypothetical protein
MTDWSVIVNLDPQAAFHMGVTEIGVPPIALPFRGFCGASRERHMPHLWGYPMICGPPLSLLSMFTNSLIGSQWSW